jgi:2,5-diamino-6-(ribosylamino)-4(3H)-pyrimidinone 5'-phosphate reductase
MVEGGARVIASFFAEPRCIDTLIITTAPLLVGGDGVGYDVRLSEVYSTTLSRFPQAHSAVSVRF